MDDPNRDQIIAREMGWYHLLDKDGEKWAENVDSLFEEELQAVKSTRMKSPTRHFSSDRVMGKVLKCIRFTAPRSI
jgi:hypothetical protein